MALTEWKDLLARLERDPESEVLAAMLTDALVEERDMPFTEAAGYVATVRKTARDALDLGYVADVIRANGPLYVHLIERVRRELGQPSGAAFVLFLIAGAGKPRMGVGIETLSTDDPGPGLYVTLPATWARALLSRSGLPKHFPRAPRRLQKHFTTRPPRFHIIEAGKAVRGR